MKVMIGVNPHKGSHTATLLHCHEDEVLWMTVRARRPSGGLAAGVG